MIFACFYLFHDELRFCSLVDLKASICVEVLVDRVTEEDAELHNKWIECKDFTRLRGKELRSRFLFVGELLEDMEGRRREREITKEEEGGDMKG